MTQANGGDPTRWDLAKYGVGLPALLTAIVLTASALLGLRSLVQAEVKQQLRPLALTMNDVKTEIKELRIEVQDLREDLALQKGKLE